MCSSFSKSIYAFILIMCLSVISWLFNLALRFLYRINESSSFMFISIRQFLDVIWCRKVSWVFIILKIYISYPNRTFFTNKSLNFISISSPWLGPYIFLILELVYLAISFMLSWVWESELLYSLTTSLLLSIPISILLSSSFNENSPIFSNSVLFVFFYKFIHNLFLWFYKELNSSLFLKFWITWFISSSWHIYIF